MLFELIFLETNCHLHKVARMYIGEKVSMLSYTNAGIPRLGVPALPYSECLHGVITSCGETTNGNTVCEPSSAMCTVCSYL